MAPSVRRTKNSSRTARSEHQAVMPKTPFLPGDVINPPCPVRWGRGSLASRSGGLLPHALRPVTRDKMHTVTYQVGNRVTWPCEPPLRGFRPVHWETNSATVMLSGILALDYSLGPIGFVFASYCPEVQVSADASQPKQTRRVSSLLKEEAPRANNKHRPGARTQTQRSKHAEPQYSLLRPFPLPAPPSWAE